MRFAFTRNTCPARYENHVAFSENAINGEIRTSCMCVCVYNLPGGYLLSYNGGYSPERRSGEINFARVKEGANGRRNIRLVSANACHRGNHKPFSWHVAAAAAAAERGRKNERRKGRERRSKQRD